jgi:hypothetical protein
MGSVGSNKAASNQQATNFAQSGSQSGQQATNFGQGSSFGSNFGQSAQGVYGAQEGGLAGLYQQAQALLGGSSAYGQQAQQIGNAGQQAWQGALTPGNANPYFGQSVQASIDQASDSFRRSVLPELESRGVAAGQYGGPRDQLARGEAAGMFGQGLAQSTAQQYSQQYGMDQQRQMQALGMTGAMQGAAYSPLQAAQSLIGGPTVLGSSSSGGQQGSSNVSGGQSSGWADAFSQAMGQSTGASKSSGMNMGFGGK